MGAHRLARRWTLLAIGAAVPFYAKFIAATDFELGGERYFTLVDDAMISMRYADNLSAGGGLMWNPDGEAVEGYSNFLWTLWMALVHVSPVPDSHTALAVMVSSVAVLAATAWVIRGVAIEAWPGRPGIAAGAAALTAFLYPLAFWSLRGMEAGVVALVIASAVLLALRLQRDFTTRRLVGLAVVLAAGVLVRDDMLVPCVVVIAYAAVTARPERRRRTLGVLVGAVVATVAAHTALRLAVYGQALPNTYYLKVSGISLWTRIERGSIGVLFALGTGLYAPALLALSYFAVRRRGGIGLPHLIAALFLSECLYSVYVGGDAWEETRLTNRYITPAIPLLLLLAVRGAVDLLELGRWRVGLALATIAGAVPFFAREWAPETLGVRGDMGRYADRWLLAALVFAAVLAALPRIRHFRAFKRAAPRAIVLGLLCLGALATFQLVTVSRLIDTEPPGFAYDRLLATAGLTLKETTGEGTPIAASAIGHVGYFSGRPVVDLLGKVDPVIARGPPRAHPFRPGHDRWNFEHSIGVMRPAVVVQLWLPTDEERCAMRRWGYTEIAWRLYVRDAASRVEADVLADTMLAAGMSRPAGVPQHCLPAAAL